MKKIVIIGGGFAGAYAAKNLERDFEVTLIDSKDYFEFTPAILRTIVDPTHIHKIQVCHKDYLRCAHIVKDDVLHVTEKEVKTKNEKYSFDYLIICSGSKYNTPIKEMDLVITTRAQELKDYATQLHKAENVLIIGGGIVGVELAGEITDKYPQKKITLVHAKSDLIERNPAKARKYALSLLKRKGVFIVFNEKVNSCKKGSYCTNEDRVIKTDLAFLCTGIIPNYDFLEPAFTDCLSEKKSLKVNNYLQVKGFERIFSAGDITDIKEEKTAQSAEKQAEVVVQNIYHLEKNEMLEKYEHTVKPMVISLGKFKGIFVYKRFVFTGVIPALMKEVIEWKTMRRYKK